MKMVSSQLFAFDQRGALKRLMAQYQTEEPTVAQMEELKVLVADELTKYASLYAS